MTTSPTRRKDKQLAGNGGQFASERDVKSATTEATLTPNPTRATMQTTAPIKHQSLQASHRSAREIARMVEDGYLDAAPEYQRPSVWTEDQRRNLVRSWLQGIPVPAVIVNERSDWPGIRNNTNVPWSAVVDGKQRIESAVMWFNGQLDVPASWFPADDVEETFDTDDGPYVTYNMLSKSRQRLLANSSSLPVVEAHLGSVEEEAELYLLVNIGGTAQSDADLSHAESVARRA